LLRLNVVDSSKLSRQEDAVLLLARTGLTDKEVAARLEIGLETVRTYWLRIRKKLGASTRAEAISASVGREAKSEIEGQRNENQALMEEIDRRRIAERLLSESELRFRALCESSRTALFSTDSRGHCRFTNSVFCKIVGATQCQLDEMSLIQVIGPITERRQLRRALVDLGRLGRHESEFTLTFPDGSRSFVKTEIRVVSDGKQAIGYTGIVSDRTQDKQLEVELAAARRLGEAISLITEAAIFILELSPQRIVYWNKFSEEFTGISAAQIRDFGVEVGKHMVHPDDRPALRQRQMEYQRIGEGDVMVNQYRVRGADGDWHYIQTRLALLKRDDLGHPSQVIGITRPIIAAKPVPLIPETKFFYEAVGQVGNVIPPAGF
jgi:PAS domain S-box-containing protein